MSLLKEIIELREGPNEQRAAREIIADIAKIVKELQGTQEPYDEPVSELYTSTLLSLAKELNRMSEPFPHRKSYAYQSQGLMKTAKQEVKRAARRMF